jgi:hypothetical protein
MMLGLGRVGDYDTSTGQEDFYSPGAIASPGYIGAPAVYRTTAPVEANYAGLWSDLIRGGFALTAEQIKRPLYQTHTTPSGSLTTIYGQGTGLNYPGGDAGPTKVPVGGVSTTTMLLLGVAAVAALMFMGRR